MPGSGPAPRFVTGPAARSAKLAQCWDDSVEQGGAYQTQTPTESAARGWRRNECCATRLPVDQLLCLVHGHAGFCADRPLFVVPEQFSAPDGRPLGRRPSGMQGRPRWYAGVRIELVRVLSSRPRRLLGDHPVTTWRGLPWMDTAFHRNRPRTGRCAFPLIRARAALQDLLP